MTLAPRTEDAYRSDWANFADWCAGRELAALPADPSTVVSYVDDLASLRRVATLKRRLAAIRTMHLRAGHRSPCDARCVSAAIARASWRQRGDARPTTPITVPQLRAISRTLPDTVAGVRDRAVILIGYGAALRPWELVSLTTAEASVGTKDLCLETGRGILRIPVGSAPELCAVAAFAHWTDSADLGDGPLFRPVDRRGRVGTAALGVKAVGRIVRRAASAAGLPPHDYTGLSLRRGMMLAAAERGVSCRTIMRQTGHRSARLVREYLEHDVRERGTPGAQPRSFVSSMAPPGVSPPLDTTAISAPCT